MRLAGTLANQHDAATFVDYLFTLGIAAKLERSGEAWDLWIFDEDQLSRSRDELAAFQADPQAERYRNAGRQADSVRRSRLDKEIAARRAQLNAQRPPFRSSHGKRPITMGLVTASLVVFLLTNDTKDHAIENKFRITAVEHVDQAIIWNSTLPEIRRGEWWRLVSPIFLHFDIAHLVMNMLALIYCGTQIEMLGGSKRLLVLALLCAIPGNLGEFYYSGPTFGGISGVVFGMFGYIWMKTLYEPWSGYYLQPVSVFLMLAFFVLGLLKLIGPMANICHGVGLLLGILLGYAPTLLRSLRRQS